MRYSFDTRGPHIGTFLPYPKDKHGAAMRGEDALATSPIAIVVCDGVGSTQLSSKHLSNYLSKSFQQIALSHFANDPTHFLPKDAFFGNFLEQMNSAVEGYRDKVLSEYRTWPTRNKKAATVAFSQLGTSSTLIGGILTSHPDGPRLRVVQRGDSLLTVFRKMPAKERGQFYYHPVYFTLDQQYEFNMPYQYSSNYNNLKNEVFVDEIKLQEDDLVVIGSDGLFDNVPLGLLTVLLNSMVAFSGDDGDELQLKLQRYVEAFVWVASFKNWAVADFFKKGIKYSLNEENHLTKSPTYSRGNKMVMDFLGAFGFADRATEFKFLAGLSQHWRDVEGNKEFPAEEKVGWWSFLTLPILEAMSMPKSGGQSLKHLRKSLADLLSSRFSFPQTRLDRFREVYPAANRALIMANLVKQVSHAPDKYPSPFFCHAWREKVGWGSNGNGKVDDISVVMAMVEQSVDIDLNALLPVFTDMFGATKRLDLEDLKADLDAYLNWHWNTKNTPPKRTAPAADRPKANGSTTNGPKTNRPKTIDDLQTVEEKIYDFAPTVEDKIRDFLPTVEDKIQDFLPTVEERIQDFVPTVEERIHDFGPTIEERIHDFMPNTENVGTMTSSLPDESKGEPMEIEDEAANLMEEEAYTEENKQVWLNSPIKGLTPVHEDVDAATLIRRMSEPEIEEIEEESPLDEAIVEESENLTSRHQPDESQILEETKTDLLLI